MGTVDRLYQDSYPLEAIKKALEMKSSIYDLDLKDVGESTVSLRNLKRMRASQKVWDAKERQLPPHPPLKASKDGASNAPGNTEPPAATQLDPQTFASLSTQYQETIHEIHHLVKNGKYDTARSLIDHAFEAEIETGTNDPGHRSTLLFFRSIVNAKQNRLNDAVEDLEEYRTSTAATPDRGKDNNKHNFSFMGKMTSFMRRSLIWTLEMEKRSKVHQDTRLQPCGNCYERRGTRRCLGCLYVMYCSRECQRVHWVVHKKICRRVGSGFSI